MSGARGAHPGAAAEAVLRRIEIPVAVWSREGAFLWANPAFARRFGGMPPGTPRAEFFAALAASGQTVDARPAEADGASAADVLHFTDGTVFRLEDWPGDGGTTITAALDVTEASRTERALRRARDTATAADQSKSRFLRAANHDLRQPLAALKILIYSCIGAETEEERQQALHAMDVSVAIMEDLLGALLNIGQLDAGKVKPAIQTFQISSVLERLRVQFEHLAREKGLVLRIHPCRAAVVSDRVLLERIVGNFLGNAIRYTDLGRVVVGCKRCGGMLRVAVLDTGSGIAPEHHEAIFDEFFRVGGERAGRGHSLGLGLNIARRLADILGHPIRMRSAPGRGSMFAVEVPIGNVWHSTIGEPAIDERIGGEFAGLSCLLIEDEIHLREALTGLLERWGIRVLKLDDFADLAASVAALPQPPDIIITDYRLSGRLQGTDAVNAINELIDTPAPAVVVTADTSPELIRAIRAQGFPVLIKPVSPASLRVMMHNLLFEPELVPELS